MSSWAFQPVLPAAAQLLTGGGGTTGGDGYMKVWDGAAWVAKPVMWYNGTSWVQKPLKFWDGASWVLAGGLAPALTVELPGTTIYCDDLGSSFSQCDFTMSNAGTWSAYGNNGSASGTWLLGGTNSDYEVRITEISTRGLASPTYLGSALSTWLNLGTTRTFSIKVLSGSDTGGTYAVEIRLAASPYTVLATGTLDMYCDAT